MEHTASTYLYSITASQHRNIAASQHNSQHIGVVVRKEEEQEEGKSAHPFTVIPINTLHPNYSHVPTRFFFFSLPQPPRPYIRILYNI